MSEDTTDQKRTPEEWREIIEAAPAPCDGPKTWEREKGDAAYELTSHCLARALLIVVDEKPELLNVEAEDAEDPRGFAAADNRKLWDAAKERWPELSAWLGGPTGFQYGWAHNIVRYIHGVDETGNPAIISVGEDKSE